MWINDKIQLIELLEKGCKPKTDWRIGTEHEFFLFDKLRKKRLPYAGNPSIKNVLQKFVSKNFSPIFEGENIIGLLGKDFENITLEPGGQIELSGAPLKNIHQTKKEISTYSNLLKKICAPMGVGVVSIGHDPLSAIKTIPWMPKGRYTLMRKYMPKKGLLGTSMMTLTATVQANLDFDSEGDMARKMYVAAALQPLSTALFANSGIIGGKPTGFQSYRAHIWMHTDDDRCGIPDCILSKNMSFEHWVDYALKVPMYFVYRNGMYHNALGKSFQDFLWGKLPGFEGQFPTQKDWEEHLSVAFPDVRLKTFIEMRGADTGSLGMLCALPAFWVGLLYDNTALDAVCDIAEKLSKQEILSMRSDVPIRGLGTQWKHHTFLELAREVVQIAHCGLKNRAILDNHGNDESIFLKPLMTILETGKTQTDMHLQHLRQNKGDFLAYLYQNIVE